ncbi:HAMP domain-containing sensor histidine kinase [Neobacillus sp. PS3-40]|uniref:HAMP domain-containing sensor histidine kinase n=1 Tax=Neobacillus sp. PS3-40 TaxID=3070679 RepID=UPI0027E19906|nr:HAMP domain-containing sensor histidine kinase [Neobacillus sp. PS3-40]WML44705.1 HAMP domain-containing sensor histidine kinase [Neobacillus sp. PS3-40]
MRDLNSQLDFRYYRIIIALINVLMVLGLLDGFMRGIHWEYFVHLLLVLILSISLWIYPKKETNFMKVIIVIESIVYLYSLFIFYPDISSSFMLLCLIPGISILFFLPRLFYFSLIINILFMTIIFSYISLVDKGESYSYLYMDLPGNVINFLASQAVLYIIFYLSLTRLKNQQLYYEQVQQAERLKTTGQLAAAVAHEIRNPITVVKGFLQFYQEDQSFSKNKQEHFAMMLEELQIAEAVISDFLSVAKPKNEIESHTINVKDALQVVAELINSYALLNNVTLKLVVEENFYIACSLIEFKQLLINLLKNAIEASPFGAPLIIQAKEQNNYVKINLIDSGNGMTEDELKSIGMPFYSLKSKGTGLGLMICFNIVHRYNGSIQFQSEIGKGTNVTVKFPSIKYIEK